MPSLDWDSCTPCAILPLFDCLELVIHHSVFGMPNLPEPHLVVTMRTPSWVSTTALLVAVAVGEPRNDLDGPLHDAFNLRYGLVDQALNLFKRLCRLHPVV